MWLLLFLAAVVTATQLHVTTDMAAFLPRSTGGDEQLLLRQLQRGSSNRMLMLGIEAADTTHAAQLSSELASALRKDERFTRVLNGKFQLNDTLPQPWFRYRYLLQDSDLSVTTLRNALQQRLQELRTLPGFLARKNLSDDPTAAFRNLLQQWQNGMSLPRQLHGVWFAPDERAVLLLETRAPGFDLDAQQQNLAALRHTFSTLANSRTARLLISGAPAIAVASRDTIRSEAQLATMAAALAVMLILLLAYRSWRLWLLSAIPLAGAMLIALATTTVLFDTVHGITIAFGITLLGVTIDYPIHLFSHLRSGDTPTHSLARIWPTLRLGVASTAIGFLSLLFTRFDGLIQLGVFTSSGLLAAALITRYLLPPLLPNPWQGRDYSPAQRPRLNTPSFSLPLTTVLLITSLAYLSLTERPLWESDLSALSPIPESVLQLDQQLRNALPVADVAGVLLIEAKDVESVLQTEERIRPSLHSWVEQGLLDGFTLAADRLPSIALQQQRQQALPSTQQINERLAQAGEGLPFRRDAFTPFIAALKESRGLPPLTLAQLQQLAQGSDLDSLLFQGENNWWGIIPLTRTEDTSALKLSVATLGENIRYVDLKAVTGGMLIRFRDDALRNLAWGALAILLLLGWSRREPRSVIQIALLLATSGAVTLALLHLFGERLTLFHLTSLLLVAGIGIDYGLFFSRTEPAEERARTAHALRVCAISTATVFAILALSRLPVLHAIGLTVLIGVITAYWLARIFGMKYNAKPGSAATASQTMSLP